MKLKDEIPSNLLLHACCGPCSTEPTRLLSERGIAFTIFYSNSNIDDAEEYEMRLRTIAEWSKTHDHALIEGEYDPISWNDKVGCIGECEPGSREHEARCRACYRYRFNESAAYAAAHGFDSLGTTLSVSPYQYTYAIEEELRRACAKYDIDCFFEDYSPYYRNTIQRSKEEGLYRQDFCGCHLSKKEAYEEREKRRKIREQVKEAKYSKRLVEEAALQMKREERKLYEEKQARKKGLMKEFKESMADACKNGEDTDA